MHEALAASFLQLSNQVDAKDTLVCMVTYLYLCINTLTTLFLPREKDDVSL